MSQIDSLDSAMAGDIALHVDLWYVRKWRQSLQRIHRAGGAGVTRDDLELVVDLLGAAVERQG